MAKKKEISGEAAGGALAEVAKTIGSAAGKVVAKVEGAGKKAPETGGAPGPAKSTKVPKLAKKNKSRLPRKEKKAQQKKADARKGPHATG